MRPSEITGFESRRFSNGDLRPAESQVNYKYVQMDVGILTGGLSPNIHRSTAVASHGLIRLLLACFCSFAERSRFNRIDLKHYLPQAYGDCHWDDWTVNYAKNMNWKRPDDYRGNFNTLGMLLDL